MPRRLCRIDEPATECRSLVARCPRGDDLLHRRELGQHLVSRAGSAVGLEPFQRITLGLHLGLHVERHLGHELLSGRGVRRGPDRGHSLLGGLDRTAWVGEHDRHSGDERCADDARPLILREVTLRCHDGLAPCLVCGALLVAAVDDGKLYASPLLGDLFSETVARAILSYVVASLDRGVAQVRAPSSVSTATSRSKAPPGLRAGARSHPRPDVSAALRGPCGHPCLPDQAMAHLYGVKRGARLATDASSLGQR